MRYLFLIILITLAFNISRAQTVTPAIVNVAGNTFTQSDITYEWSVGEMALADFYSAQDNRSGWETSGIFVQAAGTTWGIPDKGNTYNARPIRSF